MDVATLCLSPSCRDAASRGLGAGFGMTDPYTAATEVILQAVGTIGSEVTPIAADFGDKKAQGVLNEQTQASVDQSQAQAAQADASVQEAKWSAVEAFALPVGGALAGISLLWFLK
jgi:hypothetical protein